TRRGAGRRRGLCLVRLGVRLSPGAGAGPFSKTHPAPELVPASDPRFLYEGRFDFRKAAGPVVVWQASRIRLDFEGPSLALLFDDATGQSYFDVEVDEARFMVGIQAGSEGRLGAPYPLGSGRHRLTLVKRSEASAGHVRFRGVEIGPGMQAWAPQAPAYRLAVEFFGDSITAGACDEDGPA